MPRRKRPCFFRVYDVWSLIHLNAIINYNGSSLIAFWRTNKRIKRPANISFFKATVWSWGFIGVTTHSRDVESATTSSSASRSIVGSSFPRLSALRRIPAHAFALKEYFSGAFASKICDKVDSLATLGHSPVLSVIDTPGNAVTVSHDASGLRPFSLRRFRYSSVWVCDFAERLQDGSEVCALVA